MKEVALAGPRLGLRRAEVRLAHDARLEDRVAALVARAQVGELERAASDARSATSKRSSAPSKSTTSTARLRRRKKKENVKEVRASAPGGVAPVASRVVRRKQTDEDEIDCTSDQGMAMCCVYSFQRLRLALMKSRWS